MSIHAVKEMFGYTPSTDPESICDAVREEVRYGYCDVHELAIAC
jgi:hypothetical protein